MNNKYIDLSYLSKPIDKVHGDEYLIEELYNFDDYDDNSFLLDLAKGFHQDD